MIQLSNSLCNSCGNCASICPRRVIVLNRVDGRNIPVVSSKREGLCMKCGHCSAICPNNAIQIDRSNPSDFLPVNGLDIAPDQLLALLKQRRSVRRYKNKKIPIEYLDHIIEACQWAPTGSGRHSTSVILITNPDTLNTLSEYIFGFYQSLEKKLEIPFTRFFIKKKVGEARFRMLKNFVMPSMKWYIKWYRERKSNEILRDCPALMLFLSPVNEPVGASNCLISAFHAILMAQSLEIGTCFNDLIPPACNRKKEIKHLLEIPREREVYASVTLGFPRYRFKKVPPRKLFSVRHFE